MTYAQVVTSEVIVPDKECVNSNGFDINSSGKGTVNGVNAESPVVNTHKFSDNAITAMVSEVRFGCKSSNNHLYEVNSMLSLNESWLSPSMEMPSTKGLDDKGEYPSRQVCKSRFWEVEEGPTQICDVQGRLKASLNFWRNALKAMQPVLDWIGEGYKLPLFSVPPPRYQPNQKSALTGQEFVSALIQELLLNCCIHKVRERPHICSPLSVVTNADGKKRLVVYLRHTSGPINVPVRRFHVLI